MRHALTLITLSLVGFTCAGATDSTTPADADTTGADTDTTADPDTDTTADPDTDSDTQSVDPGSLPTTCAATNDAVSAELARIQACDVAADCGVVLTGTSCGCTRNLVARVDADTSRFYALIGQQAALDCGGMGSTCDCPPADGYTCAAGTCGWNYTR